MAIPKFKKEYVMDALKYIDENGVPFHNQSTKYELVTDDGKRYPPKYVVAVADYLANGTNISTDGFNAVEAKSFLEGHGFTIETKQQEKFELSICEAYVDLSRDCSAAGILAVIVFKFPFALNFGGDSAPLFAGDYPEKHHKNRIYPYLPHIHVILGTTTKLR